MAALVFPVLAAGQAPEQQSPPGQTPAPGEEVMRPTRLGVRLTPAIARGMGRLWLQDTAWRDAELSEEQERQMADAVARRMMELARRDGQQGQATMEYLIETAITTRMRLNADNCREFAEKVAPLARSMRELLEGAAEDARSILTAEQWKRMQPHFDWMKQGLDRFDRRLAGYREGQVGENENPFDELGSEEGRPGRGKENERVRSARRTVDWEIRRLTSWDWSRFLAGTASLFKFDEAQRGKGEAILAEYRKRADAIQTPEWRARVRQNGTLVNLRWQLGDAPTAPWVYRLQKQYEEDLRPLKELSDKFYGEVLALVTPQQRADALNDAREVLAKHGLDVKDADMALLQGALE